MKIRIRFFLLLITYIISCATTAGCAKEVNPDFTYSKQEFLQVVEVFILYLEKRCGEVEQDEPGVGGVYHSLIEYGLPVYIDELSEKEMEIIYRMQATYLACTTSSSL